MSEPKRKPGHQPESYDPKDMPEIMKLAERAQGQTEPQGASQATSSSGGSGSIPGIRGVWDGGKGHNFGLPDCLAFIWERLNETVKLDFWDFAAVAGDSVAMVYNRNPSTHCSYSVSGYLAGPEHTAHVFDAIGYAHDYVTVTQINANKGKYLQQVMHYIDHGLPVLALTSLADVPGWKSDVADYCLIVGYDNGGQTLLLNIEEKDGEAQLLPHGVSGDMKMDLIFIGDKQREITMEELYLGAIKNMTHWLTLPERDGMFFGAAAFRAWADDIEAGRYEDKKTHLWDDYGVYVCNLATSPAIPYFIFKKLAKINPAYTHYMALHDEIVRLFPAFKPDDIVPDDGKDGLWSELEHLRGGFNVTRKVVRNKKRRGKIAAALRSYAGRLDQAVRMLEKEVQGT